MVDILNCPCIGGFDRDVVGDAPVDGKTRRKSAADFVVDSEHRRVETDVESEPVECFPVILDVAVDFVSAIVESIV